MVQITDINDNVVCDAESIKAVPQAILDHLGLKGTIVPYSQYTSERVNPFHVNQETYIRGDDDGSWELRTWINGELKETWFWPDSNRIT